MRCMHGRRARLRAPTLALSATLALLLSLAGGAQDAPAPPPAAVYNIEIIVFRAAGTIGAAEDWSAEAGARTIAGDESAALGGGALVGHFVAALPSSAWQLTELENRLRASGTLSPATWRALMRLHPHEPSWANGPPDSAR